MSVMYIVQGVGAYVAFGLSTDVKPMSPATDSQFIEIDTGNTYIANSNAWNQVPRQSGLVSGSTIKTVNGTSLLGSGNIAIAGGSAAWGEITGVLASQTDLQTALNLKTNIASLGTLATQNGTFSGISSGTNTGDQDLSGLVVKASNLSDLANASTARTNLGLNTTANQTDSANKRFITDAQQTVLGNTSGTNTGDNSTNTQYSGLAASKQDADADLTALSNISGATPKTVPVNADLLSLWDSAASFVVKSLSWSDIKTVLQARFDTLYQAILVSGTNIKTINGSTVLGAGNLTVSGSAAWGSVTGTLSNQTDLQAALNLKANSASLGTLATQNGTFSGTSSGTNTGDQTAVSGNAGTATTLQNARTINGVSFNGSANIIAGLYARVAGSNVTRTAQTLADVTGLSVALAANAVYDVQVCMSVASSSTAGNGYALAYSAAGASVEGQASGTLAAATQKTMRISAFASSQTFVTVAGDGGMWMQGIVTTGANAGNLTVQHLKVTSGTSTVYINSYIRAIRIV